MSRTQVLIAGILAAGLIAFGVTLAALDRHAGQADVGTAGEATRCEVELGPERCPGDPGFEPARKSRIFLDGEGRAATDIASCLKRASQLHSRCKSTGQVTARFYRGNALVEIETRK